MPLVTCLQHIDIEGPGTLSAILGSKGVEVRILKPFRGDTPPEHIGDGLVVLGGPMGVYEEKRYPLMTLELDVLRRALGHSLPILGVCLGAQMLAHAAGGQVYRGALPEVGWYPVTLTPSGRRDPLFLGIPEEFEAFHWHGDTFALPPDAARLASSEWYPHQVFRIGRNAYGFQCHLEITEEAAKSWMEADLKAFTPMGGPTQPRRVTENLGEKVQTLFPLAEKIFTRFASLL